MCTRHVDYYVGWLLDVGEYTYNPWLVTLMLHAHRNPARESAAPAAANGDVFVDINKRQKKPRFKADGDKRLSPPVHLNSSSHCLPYYL